MCASLKEICQTVCYKSVLISLFSCSTSVEMSLEDSEPLPLKPVEQLAVWHEEMADVCDSRLRTIIRRRKDGDTGKPIMLQLVSLEEPTKGHFP